MSRESPELVGPEPLRHPGFTLQLYTAPAAISTAVPRNTARFPKCPPTEAAQERPHHLSRILRGDGVTQHRAGNPFGHVVADQQLATQGSSPPSASPIRKRRTTSCQPSDTKALRDQDNRGRGEAADDDVPVTDPVGQFAQARGRQDVAERAADITMPATIVTTREPASHLNLTASAV